MLIGLPLPVQDDRQVDFVIVKATAFNLICSLLLFRIQEHAKCLDGMSLSFLNGCVVSCIDSGPVRAGQSDSLAFKMSIFDFKVALNY